MANAGEGRNPRRVVVGKIDLDTVGAAFLLGVTREDELVVVRGEASSEDLADPNVICIEVGGSGQVTQNNWDHHAEDGPRISATRQVAEKTSVTVCSCGAYHWWTPVDNDDTVLGECELYLAYIDPKDGKVSPVVTWLVGYINELDTKGPEALRSGKVGFPTLSDVFAGMLLTERDPAEQLHKGVEILREVVATGQDPWLTIAGFDAYAEAKRENNRAIAEAVEKAEWTTTQGGRKLAFLETDFFGAPGALYGAGAEVVVAFSPRFGNPPVAKFTVAGNGVSVKEAAPELNAREEGWGGPPTGTILGSPRTGSVMSLDEVVQIVKKTC